MLLQRWVRQMPETSKRLAIDKRSTGRLLLAALILCAFVTIDPNPAWGTTCSAKHAAQEASRFGRVIAVFRTDDGFWVRILDRWRRVRDIFVPCTG